MARIVQVADSFDAMTEQRAYNSPRVHDDAVAELRRESGRQFDPKVVEAFLDTLPEG
jgi:HD-GYP domain-containing protein (c-di-GMP phosphodiesterase class II)